MDEQNKLSAVTKILSSSKGLAALGIILLVLGASAVVLIPNLTLQPNDKELAWKPSANARMFVQGGFFPWYQGGSIQEASLGVYIERAGGHQRFGMLADSMVQSSSEMSGEMSTEEALSLAKSHAKVSEFLETHPFSDNWTLFDGKFWHVNFYEAENWEAWAYIMINDKNREITQVYIVDGEDVYLEWPSADLDINQVVDIVLADPITTEFMETFNLTILDSWIWFDGDDRWYISFWGWRALDEEVTDSTPSNSDMSMPSFGDALFPSIPESEPRSEMIFLPPFWLTDLVSDNAAAITSTVTNYYNLSVVQHSREEVLQHVLNLNDTRDFMERNENNSYLSSNDYLEITHETSGIVTIQWWFEFYAWPDLYYIIADVRAATPQPVPSLKANTNTPSVDQFKKDFWSSLKKTFQASPSSLQAATTTELPSGIVDLYTWTFDYLIVGMSDETLQPTHVETARQPQHEASDVLSQIIATNNAIQQFVTEMESSWAYLSFDPFAGTWYLSLTPTWTYLSYLWSTVNDTDLHIIELETLSIPDELRPNMSFREVQALVSNLTVVNEFNDTYSPYGEIQTWIFYEPYYWYWNSSPGDVPVNGTTSTGELDTSGTKAWTVLISSSVIHEAWIYITINDTSGEYFLDEGEPAIMPTMFPGDVFNITSQLPEVINFTSRYPSHDVYLSYYSGTWYVFYSHYQFNDFAYVYVVIDDATSTVTEIYSYP